MIASSVYAYPWDLLDEGFEKSLDTIAELGLAGVNLAAAYHSGKLIAPRSPRRRVHFLEGGVVYFRPTSSRFQNSRIQPVASELVAKYDLMGNTITECKKRGMKPAAWVVGTHNTRLASSHLDLAARNAFGDTYINWMCPSHADVRGFLKELVDDLLAQHPFKAIVFESPGYLGFYHDYHHEFFGMSLGPLEHSLLAICFCTSCELAGKAAGLDVAALKNTVRSLIDQKLEEPIHHGQIPVNSLLELLEFTLFQPEFAAYVRVKCDLITRFVGELAGVVRQRSAELYTVGPIFVEPWTLGWVEGLDVRSLGKVVDRFDVPLYTADPERRRAEAYAVTGTQPAANLGAVICVLPPSSQALDDVTSTAAVAKQTGFSNVDFYNYGHLPRHRLEWIRDAVNILKS
jgi:hypothetical protein